MDAPQAIVEMKDFPGLMTNVDPRDLPPGAAEQQVNACSIAAGELTIRAGVRQVSFEN